MQKTNPLTVILRHRRENLKKCSLNGLETREDLLFYTYPTDIWPDCSGYLLLKVGAPPLSQKDASRGLLLLDATWRLANVMEKQLPWKLEERSLPWNVQTTYPRKQTLCPDPEAGLASVEALYLAYLALGRDTEGLLDHYYWRKEFNENINTLNFNLLYHNCQSRVEP